jgi:hypothetical protein
VALDFLKYTACLLLLIVVFALSWELGFTVGYQAAMADVILGVVEPNQFIIDLIRSRW